MAYDVTAHTPAGWPYITDSDYLRVTPAYTRELANKLENSDADVAAAINAAAQAQDVLEQINATGTRVSAYAIAQRAANTAVAGGAWRPQALAAITSQAGSVALESGSLRVPSGLYLVIGQVSFGGNTTGPKVGIRIRSGSTELAANQSPSAAYMAIQAATVAMITDNLSVDSFYEVSASTSYDVPAVALTAVKLA